MAPVLLLALLLGCGAPTDATQAQPTGASEADTAYVYRSPSRDGIGKVYMGREISRVMGHRGAAWLERPDRERTERPDLVIEGLALLSNYTVADVGAGTGYFTFRIAEAVPQGRVFAVDIQPEMLAIIEQRQEDLGVDNITRVLGTESSPELPADTLDATLLVDAYHEFAYPKEMLAAIFAATKPGGKLVLIEYRGEDPTVPIKPLHKMTEAQVRLEVEAAGFQFVANRDFLPQQHFLVFEKPG
ncbi:MAG: class I SAM-dependent methyltransferase [Bacteroidota bacterium]